MELPRVARNYDATAAALQALGVRQGDHVLSWLPNGPDALKVWFGLNYIGAVYVPINLAYKGRLLEHVIENSDAALMIAHGDLVSRLAEIKLAKLRTVVTLGGNPARIDGLSFFTGGGTERVKGSNSDLWRGPLFPGTHRRSSTLQVLRGLPKVYCPRTSICTRWRENPFIFWMAMTAT